MMEINFETALYRKYRPKSFEEILGQNQIITVLKGSIGSNNIAHAYLFSGSRGTGKTSIARILSAEIGCLANDLYEIDAASNRGIDDIRELKESINILPLESPYKVYIIDEVHMLTKEAFNALLKTLEEPPKHIVFILATTEIEKLPDTIVSRCQVFSFKRPTHNILKDLVLDIAKKEGFELELESANLIAVLGEGSFRDTLGVLQKVIGSSSNKKISINKVEIIIGAPKGVLVNDFIISVSNFNLEKGLEVINKVVENSIDIKVFVKLVLQKLRAILLLRFAKSVKGILKSEFSDNDFDFIEKVSKDKEVKISSDTIKKLLDVYEQIGKSYISQLPLELFLIDLIKNK